MTCTSKPGLAPGISTVFVKGISSAAWRTRSPSSTRKICLWITPRTITVSSLTSAVTSRTVGRIRKIFLAVMGSVTVRVIVSLSVSSPTTLSTFNSSFFTDILSLRTSVTTSICSVTVTFTNISRMTVCRTVSLSGKSVSTVSTLTCTWALIPDWVPGTSTNTRKGIISGTWRARSPLSTTKSCLSILPVTTTPPSRTSVSISITFAITSKTFSTLKGSDTSDSIASLTLASPMTRSTLSSLRSITKSLDNFLPSFLDSFFIKLTIIYTINPCIVTGV